MIRYVTIDDTRHHPGCWDCSIDTIWFVTIDATVLHCIPYYSKSHLFLMNLLLWLFFIFSILNTSAAVKNVISHVNHSSRFNSPIKELDVNLPACHNVQLTIPREPFNVLTWPRNTNQWSYLPITVNESILASASLQSSRRYNPTHNLPTSVSSTNSSDA